MATTTVNYGWGVPASGDAQPASELMITATLHAIDAALAAAVGGGAGWYEPVTNSDLLYPEIVFDAGDVVVDWVVL